MNQIAVVEKDAVVASMSRARMALAEARTIQQTKLIVDTAAAAEIYAKRQKLGEEASELALSIKIEALRKLGEMLAATPRNEGAKGIGKSAVPKQNHTQSAVPEENRTPTLAELGLTKKESAVAQKLAALPEKDFRAVRDGHVTVAKAIAAVDAAKQVAQPAPAPEPAPRKAKRSLNEVPADIEPIAEADEMDELRRALEEVLAENETLKDRLALEAMEATEEEKLSAFNTLNELRVRVKALEAECDALRVARDQYMHEAGEAKKTALYWQKQAKKAGTAC